MMNTQLPKKVHDLTGRRFGRVTVLEFVELDLNRAARWRCRCDCGTVFVANAANLVHGHTKSCGCFRRETSSRKAGMTSKAWSIPVIAVINGEEREFESIKSASRYIGCAPSTVRLATRTGIPFRGIKLIARRNA